MERIVQILSRRKKNNPILIGEAGVGKSAIVEGLALRMAADEVPATIRGKRLYSLDVSSLLAGTKYRGEFEERMQRLLEELRRKQDSILFIDEIHTIAGAGSTQGSLDTANILKPALARGELQVIGHDAGRISRRYRERSRAGTPLQKILVEPASEEETLQILHNIAPHYERHHGVPLLGRSIAGLRRPDRALHYRPQLSGQGDRRAGRSRGTYSPAGQRQNRKNRPEKPHPANRSAPQQEPKRPKTAPAKRRQRTRRLVGGAVWTLPSDPARPKSGPSISSRLLPP